MNGRSIFSLSTITAFALAVLPTSAVSQQKSLKEQLVGVWTLVSAEMAANDGAKIPFVEGSNLKGLLVFADNHFSLQIISEYPKLASNDRLVTTPEEDKATAHGVLSYFGTYTVSDADKVLTFQIERSSYPNQNGVSTKRPINSLTGNELKLRNPGNLVGSTNELAWRRLN
jgi:hypothetical protein